MDKKTILALIIIGAVFLLWPVYMRKVVGVRSPSTPSPSDSLVQEQEWEAVESVERPVQPQTLADSQRSAQRSESQSEVARREYDIEPNIVKLVTNLFEGRLSSLGGGTVVRWKLKQYLNQDGEGVELLPDSADGNLSIILGSRMDLGQMVFNTVLDSQWVENGKHFQKVRFGLDLPGGGRIEKEFRVQDDSYAVDMEVRFSYLDRQDMGQGYDVLWTSGLHPTERISDDMHYYQAYALQGGELLKTKDKSTGLREGGTQWVAVRTKYFLMALIPREILGKAARLEGQKTKIPYRDEGLKEWRRFHVQLAMPSTGHMEETAKFALYIGPMDYPQLKGQGVQLEKMMNFGWSFIRPFSIAFLYALQFLYGIVGNFGWAIVIFSILIKVVLYPLTRKSFQSMRKMQELQPKMSALKEKYKKDSQKLNQETMKLYKQHGVNPMGGCLPMLLQMPVLFALFNLFRTTIMLRQASFLGGLIADLSAPDAMIGNINVLPILMGATMIIQQKLSTQNPQQKAMAYLMPIIFSFMFYRFSAGLNLYYLMFNLLTIAQELIIRKHK